MVLLYIQLTISFLIGRRFTVNFWNQRLGRHLPADYTIIMSWTLKTLGNHVMYDCSAWLLRLIMSCSHPLCCVPLVNKQKRDMQACFVYWARHKKKIEDKDLQNTKKSMKVAKELFADYVKEKKLREPEEKKELAETSRLCSSRAQWPLAPNFCSWAARKSYFFRTNHMLGTQDFTGSEPGLPSIFLRAQPWTLKTFNVKARKN